MSFYFTGSPLLTSLHVMANKLTGIKARSLKWPVWNINENCRNCARILQRFPKDFKDARTFPEIFREVLTAYSSDRLRTLLGKHYVRFVVLQWRFHKSPKTPLYTAQYRGLSVAINCTYFSPKHPIIAIWNNMNQNGRRIVEKVHSGLICPSQRV